MTNQYTERERAKIIDNVPGRGVMYRFCHYCKFVIQEPRLFRKPLNGRRTKYYHIECAKTAGFEINGLNSSCGICGATFDEQGKLDTHVLLCHIGMKA